MRKVTLLLSDGTRFHGTSFGYEKPVAGEVVFNTAMTGYPESLTDPSYAGQLMTLTYPLVGNYGVPAFSIEDNNLATFMESDKIYARAGRAVGAGRYRLRALPQPSRGPRRPPGRTRGDDPHRPPPRGRRRRRHRRGELPRRARAGRRVGGGPAR